MNTSPKQRDEIARRIRGKVITLSHEAKAPHLGSALSCVDILVAAYWGVLKINPSAPEDPDRDRLILSKGHAAVALYVTLAARGFFAEQILDEYGREGGRLQEHPGPRCVPWVEAATGSLGHGLPIGNGLALGARIQRKNYRVFVIMSDGECEEGSVWEAALFAAAQKLDNLTVIIDYNKWQATGRSNEVMALPPLAGKWERFGWETHEVNGHDLGALSDLMCRPNTVGMPRAIVAHTIKGKGVSFMEDDNNWHYRIPDEDEVRRAHVELGLI